MAVFQNDPFPGTDYGQYLNWQRVTTPDGQVYYVVPGNEGYVFDPVASNATGRKVFRRNPKGDIDKQKEAEDLQKKAIEQEQFNRSPAGQLIPVAGTTGGLILANQIMKPGATAIQVLKDGSVLMSDGTIQAAKGTADVVSNGSIAAQGAAGNASAMPPSAPTSPALPPEGVQSLPDGSTLMSDGTVQTNTLPEGAQVQPDGSIVSAETGATIGNVVQGAFGAYQIYQGAMDFKKDKVGGGLGIASGAANVGAALGSETAGAFAAPLLAAKGAYDFAGSLQRGGEGIRGAGTTLGAGIGTMILPGVGTVAGAALGNLVGYGVDKMGIAHKTTKQRETGRWEDAGIDPEKYQQMIGYDYFTGTEGQQSRDEKYLTADAIRFNPDNYNNVKDWDEWNKAEQDEFLNTLLSEGRVSERKGGIYYDDARAQELADQIRKKRASQPLTSGQSAAKGAITAQRMPGR